MRCDAASASTCGCKAAPPPWRGLAWLFGPPWRPTGSLNPPTPVRGTMLAAVGIVLLVLLVRLIGRRAFVRITDSNAAMVLERRFPVLTTAC